MGDINQALGGHGSPYQLAVAGKTYLLQPLTKAIQGEFEAWLEGRSRAEIKAMRKSLSQDDYIALVQANAAKIAAGAYSFGRPLAAQALQSEAGMVQMIYLLLQRHQPEIEVEDVAELLQEHGDDFAAALTELFSSGKRKGQPTPKPPAAA